MIGAARIMGYEVMENFNKPYFARSIREFWTRWHISLTTWFRDYVYIPLGGNRVARWRGQVNLMIGFLISGLGTRTWTSDNTAGTLGVSWDADNTADASSTQTFTNWRGSFSSANHFSFKVGDTTPSLPGLTITEAATGATAVVHVLEKAVPQ